MPRCKATSKRTKEPCKAQAVTGRDLCYHHGGRTPVGIALPQTKTGQYSKHIPGRLQEHYNQAEVSTELLNQRAAVALLEARLLDVLSRVDSGESGQLWAMLQQTWEEYKAAERDYAKKLAARAKMDSLIQQGLSDYVAWSEVTSLIQQKRKVIESERKAMIEAQQMVRLDQAMLFVRAVMSSVRTHVTDQDALAGIAGDLSRLLASGEHRDALPLADTA